MEPKACPKTILINLNSTDARLWIPIVCNCSAKLKYVAACRLSDLEKIKK